MAGGRLDLLAAEDSDYSLDNKKKKGSFGSKKTQRDEVTQITNIGSEITTGGDLTLESGSDQHYLAAKLNSGGDLTIDSGGDITFEAVKDLHQESHEKSKSDAGWFSMKGKGSTDETVRQSELVAQGELVINAVGTIHADVLQVNQQTVHESIDAMVKADPKLAWLKELEAQGGVDWRQVEEIHTSFKYSNSGLGPAAQIIIAIIMAAVVGPAAMGALGAAGASTAVAAGGAAVATSAATNAAVSVVNNRGNLGAVLKDVTSSDAMKGYVIAGVTAGITEGLIDPKLKGTNAAFKNTAGFDLSTLEGIGGFSLRAGAIGVTSGAIKTVVSGGSFGDNLANGLVTQAANVTAAVGFNFVGNYAEQQFAAADLAKDSAGMAMWAEGGAGRVALHALMGGAVSAGTGGDFISGAVAAGASQALAGVLNDAFETQPKMREAFAQIVGIASAGLAGGDIEKGSWVAQMADQYNRQAHPEEMRLIKQQAEALAKDQNISVAEAEQRMARAFAYYTDKDWQALLIKDGLVIDAKTMVHLGQALAPLATWYEVNPVPAIGDVPLSTGIATYTSEQTVALLQGYATNHSDVFNDAKFNSEYLLSGVGGRNAEYADYYDRNLNFNAIDSGAQLIGAGKGVSDALIEMAKGIYGLGEGLVTRPLDTANGVLEELIASASNPTQVVNAFLQAKQDAEVQARLYRLQGKVEDAARVEADWQTEFYSNFVALNRAVELGKTAQLLAAREAALKGLDGPCCFAAGTLVATPDGDRAIETLEVGDIVWSKPEHGGEPFPAAILATHVRNDQPIYKLVLENTRLDGKVTREILMVTPGHPFYVPAKRDFIPVIDLKPGDLLQSLADGDTEDTSSKVESLGLYLPEGNTYNLTVDVGHTFYVGKLKTWVHNTGPCRLPPDYFEG
ncbi:DUF637 domain-containing protein, partial [Pseudomonas sp. 5P_5.1_Bac1]